MSDVKAIYVGKNSDEQLLKKIEKGSFLEVNTKVIEGNRLNIDFPSIPEMENTHLSVGDADAVVLLVVKDAPDGVIEVEAVYSSVSISPKMCCQCGRVRVCGSWCACVLN